MTHPTSPYTYHEILTAGMYSTEAKCSQYLLDKEIFPTKRRCSLCPNHDRMEMKPSHTYKDRCCHMTFLLKFESFLENGNLSYNDFILILAFFAEGLCVTATSVVCKHQRSTVNNQTHLSHNQTAYGRICLDQS